MLQQILLPILKDPFCQVVKRQSHESKHIALLEIVPSKTGKRDIDEILRSGASSEDDDCLGFLQEEAWKEVSCPEYSSRTKSRL